MYLPPTLFFRASSGYTSVLLTSCMGFCSLLKTSQPTAKAIGSETWGLAKESLQLISDNLSCRKERTKIGAAYSDWANVIRGIPQGSLWDLFFTIFKLMTFFLSLKSQMIINFADDNTMFSYGTNLPLFLSNLEHDMRNLLYWFKINSLKETQENFSSWFLGKSIV